jgi:hypothetical protein
MNNLDKQYEDLKKLAERFNLAPEIEAALREKPRRRSMWNQRKLLNSGWTKELIASLLGGPDEILPIYIPGVGKAEKHLFDPDRIKKAQRDPAFQARAAKRQMRKYRVEKPEELPARVEDFLYRTGLRLDERKRAVLETIWPALEAEAKKPSDEGAEVILFPKRGPKNEKWFRVFKRLVKAGFIEIAPGTGLWANVSWKMRPVRSVNLTGPAVHEDLFTSGDDSDELAYA